MLQIGITDVQINKMSDLEALRSSILNESDPLGSKRRFGLFSQPITTAIGDDSLFRTRAHPRDQAGKPVTQARNFCTSPTKSGQLKSSFFGAINSLASGEKKDYFIEESNRLRKEELKKFNQGRKETNYFPISGTKELTNSAYPHIDEKNPELDPRRHRNQDGRVVSAPRNFVTSPQSRVIKEMFKHPPHIDDPYDRLRNAEVEHNRKERAKQFEAKFRPNSFVSKTFNKDKKVYGCEIELPKVERAETKLNIFPHEAPWKRSSPPKQGIVDTISPFPAYVENPPRQVTRRSPESKEKEIFKKMSASLTTPTPSVTLNRVNMMRHVNRSFTQRS